MSDRLATGMATRRRVLGNEHVDRAESRKTAFDAPFQEFIAEGVWGSVWSRPELTPRERSLITLALLAAQGHWEELALHVRATANTGATPTDVREAILHVAAYAGVPAANHALQVARKVFADMGIDP